MQDGIAIIYNYHKRLYVVTSHVHEKNHKY